MAKPLLIASLLLASLAPQVASATMIAPLPRYDVKAACQGSASGVSGCTAAEKAAFESLRVSWAGLTKSTRANCQHVATSTGPASYALLLGCVAIESEPAAGDDSMVKAFEEGEF